MKKSRLVLAIFAAACAAASRGDGTASGVVNTNVVAELKRICDTHDPDISEYALLEGSFEIRFSQGFFEPLVEAVSNDWQSVITNLDAYATNTAQRLLLLNTGWWLGESVHLGYLSTMCGLVEAGHLNANEFDAYNTSSWRNHVVGSALARRYDEPAVSNLLQRIRAFSSRTNYWNDVISGRMKQDYLEEVEAGLWQ